MGTNMFYILQDTTQRGFWVGNRLSLLRDGKVRGHIFVDGNEKWVNEWDLENVAQDRGRCHPAASMEIDIANVILRLVGILG